METIGEYLKRVREACGYSLEDVAGITKINLRYLEAIDLDALTKIPGDTFYYGFVRSYAKCLGISDEEISRRIRETAKAAPQAVNTQNRDHKAIRDTVSKPGKARVILPIAAGVIVTALLLMLFIGGRDSGTMRNAKESREVPAEIAEVQPQTVQQKTEPVVLKIYAHELTWVSARIDDKETKDVMMKPGEGVMWNGKTRIVITVGNAGGIDIDVNGKTFAPFGKRGAVIRDAVITSAGVSKP